MTMDRREFVTTGLAALTAAGAPLAQGTKKPTETVGGNFSLELMFKGQFVYITEGRRLFACCLKGEGHPNHIARVYVHDATLDRSRTVPEADHQIRDGDNGWSGWNLDEHVRLLHADSTPLRLARAVVASHSATGGAPWPTPVNDDSKWNDHAYIPQLSSISPQCEVKTGWKHECKSYWELDATKLRPRKPCTPEDVVSVWTWRDMSGNATHLSAVTDLVSYPIFDFQAAAKLILQIGKIGIPMIVNGKIELPVVCAPQRTSPPARVAYTAATRLGHFENIYRVLQNHKPAAMEFVTTSADPGTVQGTKCNIVFNTLDDDIFCPGGEPPPIP